jgi:hypothetical protein
MGKPQAVTVSMQDNLQDLLLPKKAPKDARKLEIKKDAKGMVVVEGATLVSVASLEELEATVKRGQEKRHIAGTQMNMESSRSHLVLSIIIESTNLQTQALVKGKLSFVDLAGSERVKKSGSTGEQLKVGLKVLRPDTKGGNGKVWKLINSGLTGEELRTVVGQGAQPPKRQMTFKF